VLDLAGRKEVSGIGPRRAEIIVAGVAVLSAVIEELGLTRLYYSSAGVRDGIIADLAHRKVGMEQARMEDDQRLVVLELARKYGISTVHVRKVAELANMLFDGLLNVHQLPLACGRLLEAAAHLYNIGHFVNEARHHRHSMYLVANSDLPGFSDRERMTIASLCRYHRKSLPQPSHEVFQAMPEGDRHVATRLTPLLRLAVALDQSQEQRVQRIETVVHDAGIEVRLYSERDVDIEQWHAQQTGEAFRAIYGKPLAVKAKR
jgi:exopolyphosphatase/guanosine-5'-triphosphate,3'-diphosphate pyrophosphatase